MANQSLNKKLPAEVPSQPLNLGPGELWQAEESFVFRLWQQREKISTIRPCSIIQACLNGEGLMRNVAFEKSGFKNSQSILTVQVYTIIINRIQTANQGLCYYFTQFDGHGCFCSILVMFKEIFACYNQLYRKKISLFFLDSIGVAGIREKKKSQFKMNRSCPKAPYNPHPSSLLPAVDLLIDSNSWA